MLAVPAEADAASKLPAGFIALSESPMTWDQAKVFCQHQGGRLPFISGKESLGSVPSGTPIDGFGTIGGRWPTTDLPDGYWTGTEVSQRPGSMWVIDGKGGHVSVGDGFQSDTNCVVCVASAASKRPTGFMAADPLPAGVIAIAPDKMNWKDAMAYCSSKGGRLPLIGGSNKRPPQDTPSGTPVDGFGTVGAKWPSSLLSDYYWTGAENSLNLGYSWIVKDDDDRGIIGVFYGNKSYPQRVICVP